MKEISISVLISLVTECENLPYLTLGLGV